MQQHTATENVLTQTDALPCVNRRIRSFSYNFVFLVFVRSFVFSSLSSTFDCVRRNSNRGTSLSFESYTRTHAASRTPFRLHESAEEKLKETKTVFVDNKRCDSWDRNRRCSHRCTNSTMNVSTRVLFMYDTMAFAFLAVAVNRWDDGLLLLNHHCVVHCSVVLSCAARSTKSKRHFQLFEGDFVVSVVELRVVGIRFHRRPRMAKTRNENSEREKKSSFFRAKNFWIIERDILYSNHATNT